MREGVPFLPAGDRLGAVVSLAAYLDSSELGAAIDALIARLDAAAGDPDLEANGDELDGNLSEDDVMHHGGSFAGCPVSDPGEDDDADEDDDPAGGNVLDERHDADCEDEPDDADSRALRKPHRDRIRRTQCDRTEYRNTYDGRLHVEYRLRNSGRSVR